MSFEIGNLVAKLSATDDGMAATVSGMDSKLSDLSGQFAHTHAASEQAFSGANGSIEKTGEKVQKVSDKLKFLVAGMIAFGTSAVMSFVSAEQTSARLDAALETAGANASATKEHVAGLVKEMKKISDFGGGEIKGALGDLAMGDKIADFDRASKTMLDLGARMGDLSGAAHMLSQALNDPVEGSRRLHELNIRFSESERESMQAMIANGQAAQVQAMILDRIDSKVGGFAQKLGGTLSGQIMHATNAIKGLTTEFGGLVAGGLAPVMGIAEQFLDWVKALDPGTMKIVQTIAAFTAVLVVVGAVLPTVTAAFGVLGAILGVIFSPIGLIIAGIAAVGAILLETMGTGDTFGEKFGNMISGIMEWIREAILVIENWSLAWETIKLATEVAVVHIYDRVEWFASAAWEYIKWFFDNFADIAETVCSNVGEMFKNLGHNVWVAIKQMFTSDDLSGELTDAMAGVKDIKGPEIKDLKLTDYTKQQDEIKAKWAEIFKKKEEATDVGKKAGGNVVAQKLQVKVEASITSMADVFKKNLEDQFNKDDKKGNADLLGKQIDNQQAQIDQANNVGKNIVDAINASATAPVAVGA